MKRTTAILVVAFVLHKSLFDRIIRIAYEMQYWFFLWKTLWEHISGVR
jgi:hypothetical protein